MLKVLHTADWHYNDKDHDEIRKCVDFMISSARKELPDLILIAGDITHSQNLKFDTISARTICRQVSELADIAPVAIIIGTPSHDGKAAMILQYVRGKYQIHVSEKPEQLYLRGTHLYTADPGSDIEAVITQIPTPTKQFFQEQNSSITESDHDIAKALTHLFGTFGVSAASASCPHILCGHFQVGGAYISDTQQLVGRDIEISTDQIAMANAHLICLGHIHKQQKINENIYYSGSITRQNFGEMETKGFYYHYLSQNTPDFLYESDFIEVPSRKLTKWNEDFTKRPYSSDDILLLDPNKVQGAHIKLDFKVWQDEAGNIDQSGIERTLLEAGAEKVNINLIRVPRETVRCARVLTLNSLSEKISEMATVRLESISKGILTKADLLENTNEDELVKIAGGMN